ncbi:MAG TPA: UDP-N-acetylglucosamine 2-epimerase (non-hydrolyzing) [Verrucomicrobiota bacterium]|nr:UDP-N-acetylglucosamine 2-epimerase (non-hydrolyzing) [Verrucomicrobiota bacterium]HQK00561.1 UDP-N-acetylglucosamine 2-epimerase (non-hydrolyzing) [Verrucomicrobiota bacterium]
MKIMTVVGARPQFIKAAPVSAALAKAGLVEYLLHTGQHYDRSMSDVFFEELGLRSPDLNLDVGSASHAKQTAAMLVGIEEALIDQRPNWLLVYGDTNSTLAGALAAAKLHIPVAHVEAGLRSFNRRMPEEINRIAADALSTLLFVPTETARQNLEREGQPAERIVWTGDVMYDAALAFGEHARKRSRILETLGLEDKKYVLATVHRAENTDDAGRLDAILNGLTLAARELPVVFPVHPRTRKVITQLSLDLSGLRFIDPVGFLDMVRLEQGACVIATDSGGVQKEAFFHRVPCVTLRGETEWVETLTLEWNRLCPPVSSEAIAAAVLSAAGRRGTEGNPYGDGGASLTIAAALTAFGNLP